MFWGIADGRGYISTPPLTSTLMAAMWPSVLPAFRACELLAHMLGTNRFQRTIGFIKKMQHPKWGVNLSA
jgi:hypothetical protein